MRKTGLLWASTALTLVLASGIAVFAVEEPAEAAFAGENNGKIAFIASDDGGGPYTYLQAMNADGTSETSLVSEFEVEKPENPAWSPDGESIAFTDEDPATGNSRIAVVDTLSGVWLRPTAQEAPDGAEALPTRERQPAWSPDGGSIAFAATQDGNEDIYKVPADNGSGVAPTRLTTGAQKEHDPAWSGSGIIAYTAQEDENSDAEIHAMDADGANQRALTDNAFDDVEADWSPDGQKVVFASDRDGDFEIYTMNADGTGQTRVTDNARYDGDPVWSPDGKKIAFVADGPAVTGRDVFVMDEDGTDEVGLMPYAYSGAEKDPDWQQDGTSPGVVSQFTARAGDGQVALRWDVPRPTTKDLASVRIFRSTIGYAESHTPEDGQTLVSDNLSVSYTDRNLTNDTTYYYTAYTRDFAGNWSGPATAVGTPVPAAATTLAISSSARAVAYKGEVVLTGKLLTSEGEVAERKTIVVQRSTDGGATWKNDGTAAYDAVSKSYKTTRFLTANSRFRLQFGGDPYYSAASSPQVSVKARAYLSQPVVPTGVKKNVAFTVSGYLEPLHAESTRLHFYYYEDGAYRPYKTVDVPNVKHDFDTAKYALRYKLPYAGKWQVKAYHADASHAPTWSPAKTFVVKQ